MDNTIVVEDLTNFSQQALDLANNMLFSDVDKLIGEWILEFNSLVSETIEYKGLSATIDDHNKVHILNYVEDNISETVEFASVIFDNLDLEGAFEVKFHVFWGRKHGDEVFGLRYYMLVSYDGVSLLEKELELG